jgi:hypothetical protein
MATWYTIPKNVPTNGQTVWVRVKYFYSQPFQAVYNTASQSFTSVTNSIVFPAWTIARWQP